MFTIMKALNKFKHYISQNKIILLTIHLVVKSYIMQGELDFDKVRWITKVLQYNTKIHLTKVNKGIPLYKQLVEDQISEYIMIIEAECENRELPKLWKNKIIR